MIARYWHGETPAAKADAYAEYLGHTGVRDYRATPGNRGVLVLRRLEGDRAHFHVFSFWESFESIRAFAGDDVERARYYPEDDEYLLGREPSVRHSEVLVLEVPPPSSEGRAAVGRPTAAPTRRR